MAEQIITAGVLLVMIYLLYKGWLQPGHIATKQPPEPPAPPLDALQKRVTRNLFAIRTLSRNKYPDKIYLGTNAYIDFCIERGHVSGVLRFCAVEVVCDDDLDDNAIGWGTRPGISAPDGAERGNTGGLGSNAVP